MSGKLKAVRINVSGEKKWQECWRLEDEIHKDLGIMFDTGYQIGSGKRDWMLDTLSDQDQTTVVEQLKNNDVLKDGFTEIRS